MKPGSVVVDLAAEAGGNIETTVPGDVSVYSDVTHIGLTDLPSRLPTQASFLYGNNISKFLLSIGEKDHFNINLEDEVVRGSIILQNGKMMWPPPPAPQPSPAAVASAPAVLVKEPPPPPNYFNLTMKDALMYTSGKYRYFKNFVFKLYPRETGTTGQIVQSGQSDQSLMTMG